jgi:hypothetical protein
MFYAPPNQPCPDIVAAESPVPLESSSAREPAPRTGEAKLTLGGRLGIVLFLLVFLGLGLLVLGETLSRFWR